MISGLKVFYKAGDRNRIPYSYLVGATCEMGVYLTTMDAGSWEWLDEFGQMHGTSSRLEDWR